MSLKPAPFALTEGVVAGVLCDRPSSSPRVIPVPLLPIKLVDRPRRSQDPHLARANDDTSGTGAANG